MVWAGERQARPGAQWHTTLPSATCWALPYWPPLRNDQEIWIEWSKVSNWDCSKFIFQLNYTLTQDHTWSITPCLSQLICQHYANYITSIALVSVFVLKCPSSIHSIPNMETFNRYFWLPWRGSNSTDQYFFCLDVILGITVDPDFSVAVISSREIVLATLHQIIWIVI